MDLKQFARKVNDVARKSPEEYKFGPNKVYIYWVWALGFKSQMNLDKFKSLLKQASQEGLVYLSRADLVSVMNQDWLRKSEIQFEKGSITNTAHFVLIR